MGGGVLGGRLIQVSINYACISPDLIRAAPAIVRCGQISMLVAALWLVVHELSVGSGY